jgi:ParB family chromosome partitioning protein
MTTKHEEALLLAAAALAPDSAPRAERRPARVAMNAVTDFTGELSKTEQQRDAAVAELALHQGSWPTRKLDPKTIRPSRFANRIVDSFEGPVFEQFKQEIESAGGNVQAIKVRPVEQGVYEIVYGHRRHKACLDLNLPVLATIQDGMSDQVLFEEMSRENEARADLTAYELAAHYKRGIDQKLYKNWAALAAALGKSKGLISRYTALAELPKAIVEAFPSPNAIQAKWAMNLRGVLETDRDAVMAAAKALKGRGLAPKATYEILMNRVPEKFTRVNFSFGAWLESASQIQLSLKRTSLAEDQIAALQALLKSFETTPEK